MRSPTNERKKTILSKVSDFLIFKGKKKINISIQSTRKIRRKTLRYNLGSEKLQLGSEKRFFVDFLDCNAIIAPITDIINALNCIQMSFSAYLTNPIATKIAINAPHNRSFSDFVVFPVNASGVISGLKEGSAYITATSKVDSAITARSQEIRVVSKSYRDATDSYSNTASVFIANVVSQYLKEKDNSSIKKDNKGFSSDLVSKIIVGLETYPEFSLGVLDMEDMIKEVTEEFPLASYKISPNGIVYSQSKFNISDYDLKLYDNSIVTRLQTILYDSNKSIIRVTYQYVLFAKSNGKWETIAEHLNRTYDNGSDMIKDL
ncbi:MAG: hypothetical protein EZS28_033885, partial [Streblomastix strix]